jgi:serine/threonine protein kinase
VVSHSEFLYIGRVSGRPWVDDELRSLVGVTVDASPVTAQGGSSAPRPPGARARFRLEHPLGEGGTGVAFFALRIAEDGDSPHVVKVFRPALLLKAPEIAEVSRRKEHTAMRRINERVPPSPYIVRMVDTGEMDVSYRDAPVLLPWIASEYVNGGLEGTTLGERMSRCVEATGVGFDPERVLRVLRCVTEGLAAIHEVGVIHRDIKPDNVLLCGFAEDEVAKITDFGVARARGLESTFGPQPVGTIGYAAPEQLGLLGAPTTEATDVFALGVLLYKMLAADDYFRRVPFSQLAIRKDDGKDPRPHLRDAQRLHPEFKAGGAHLEALDQAIRKATSVQPTRRFQSAREFRGAIDPHVRALIRPTTAKGRKSKTRERLRTLMMSGGGRMTWTARHRPGDDRVLRAVAWEPDGRCLAVAREQLAYWDGRSWFDVPTPAALRPGTIELVLRISAGHFLLGGAGGVLVELTEGGWGEVGPAGDPRLVFHRAAGSPESTLVVCATHQGTPCIYVSRRGEWLAAQIVPGAAFINDVTELDESRFVLVGRAQSGGSYVAIYDSNSHVVTPVATSQGRPFLAVAGDVDGCAFAVGPAGTAASIRIDPARGPYVDPEPTTTERDLSTVAVDPAGVAFACAQGRVMKRISPGGVTTKWEALHVYDWLVPVVGLLAAGGGIFAVTVDGAILEGREDRVEIGSLVPPQTGP